MIRYVYWTYSETIKGRPNTWPQFELHINQYHNIAGLVLPLPPLRAPKYCRCPSGRATRRSSPVNALTSVVFKNRLVIKWKRFPRNRPFVPVNSPHKGQWRGALIFSLISVWINGWVNKREAGDLTRHRGHYDVNIMIKLSNQHICQNINFGSLHTSPSFYYDYNFSPLLMILIWGLFGSRQLRDLPSSDGYFHDDVIKWKHFPRNWPFVRRIHRSRWIPHRKASDAELWCFFDLRLNKRLSKQPRGW